MEPDEFAFIQKRHDKESREFMRAMNVVLAFAVIIPFLTSLFYYVKFQDTGIMLSAFVISLVITMILFVIIAYFTYQRTLSALKHDLREQTKIVESTLITEKKYMALNHTYHFFLYRAFKISIEVNEVDFARFDVNDEINIEYARYSKEYFGYF
jgi:uncharacterized membrane protein YozB (DUF420 family)